MKVDCPHCGSSHVRESAIQSGAERVARFLGILQLRCRDCDTRFSRAIWDLRNIVYARCPRCYRLELSHWDTSHYHAPLSWHIFMKLGAKPVRCDRCRKNFVSFRPAKGRPVRMKNTAPA